MKCSVEPWSIDGIRRRWPRINPSPPYQRGPVWSLAKKQLLIDSILRKIDIPKLYLRSFEKGPYSYEVVDGQQRLRTISEFSDSGFPLSDEADAVDGYNVAGKVLSELSDALKDKFCGYQLTIVDISEATDEEIEEMFLRLNNGETLRSAERRNAMAGKITPYVRNMASHEFFKSVGFKTIRYSHDSVAAQMLLLETNGGPCNVRDVNLRQMYIDCSKAGVDSQTDKKIKKVLNFLAKAFPDKTPELKKANTVTLYLVTSHLLGQYAMSRKEKDFHKWFIKFEERMRAGIDKPEDSRDQGLVSFQKATAYATNDMDSVKYRHDFLLTSFLAENPEVEKLDSQREFSEAQRIAIYRRDRGICKECMREVKFNEEFHADHMAPHSRGGKTTVSNGQLLCCDCNKRKAAKGFAAKSKTAAD